jgi:hypothetical protein
LFFSYRTSRFYHHPDSFPPTIDMHPLQSFRNSFARRLRSIDNGKKNTNIPSNCKINHVVQNLNPIANRPPRRSGIRAYAAIVIGELIPTILDDLAVKLDDVGVLQIEIGGGHS